MKGTHMIAKGKLDMNDISQNTLRAGAIVIDQYEYNIYYQNQTIEQEITIQGIVMRCEITDRGYSTGSFYTYLTVEESE